MSIQYIWKFDVEDRSGPETDANYLDLRKSQLMMIVKSTL